MFPLTISFEQYSLSEAEISFLWAGINKEETYTAIRWSGSQLTAATWIFPVGWRLLAGHPGARPRLLEAELAPAATEKSLKLLAMVDPAGPTASGSGLGKT